MELIFAKLQPFAINYKLMSFFLKKRNLKTFGENMEFYNKLFFFLNVWRFNLKSHLFVEFCKILTFQTKITIKCRKIVRFVISQRTFCCKVTNLCGLKKNLNFKTKIAFFLKKNKT